MRVTLRAVSTLAVIPCSREKVWDLEPKRGAVQAAMAYRSAFHHLARAYAEKHADGWVILSAKYGFLAPADIVEGAYDVTFGRPDDPTISDQALARQATSRWAEFSTVLVLTPKLYEQRVRDAFQFAQIIAPLKGVGGWGHMHRFLRDAIG
jgi:hypothetical protein